jgi:hypothetical protein
VSRRAFASRAEAVAAEKDLTLELADRYGAENVRGGGYSAFYAPPRPKPRKEEGRLSPAPF